MMQNRKSGTATLSVLLIAVLVVSSVKASDVFDQEIKSFHDEMLAELEHAHNLNAAHLETLLSQKKDVCTNGIDS
jgi:hypothetical protein